MWSQKPPEAVSEAIKLKIFQGGHAPKNLGLILSQLLLGTIYIHVRHPELFSTMLYTLYMYHMYMQTAAHTMYDKHT